MIFSVTLNVFPEFIFPKFAVTFGDVGFIAIFMLMPKATVNEDDTVIFFKNYVGRSGQFPYVLPESKSHAVQN